MILIPGKSIPFLQDNLWKLEDSMDNNKDTLLKLMDDIWISTKAFHGGRWICFQLRDPEDWKQNKFVSIPQDDFQIIILRLEYIMDKLGLLPEEHQPPLRRRIFTSLEEENKEKIQGDTFFQFKVKVKSAEGGFSKRGKQGHLTWDLANDEGLRLVEEAKGEGIYDTQIEIFRTPILKIQPTEMMEACFLNQLISEVEIKAHDHCEGCYLGCPSQKDHLEKGGCLTPLKERVEMFYNMVAGCKISAFNLQVDFCKISSKMGLKRERGLLLLAGAVIYLYTKEKALSRLESEWFQKGRGFQMLQVLKM